MIASRIKLRQPARELYEHKIWAWLDIIQVLVFVDSQQKIKLRRPAQEIYEHKIWVLLDIDQVMIDIQSWRETD